MKKIIFIYLFTYLLYPRVKTHYAPNNSNPKVIFFAIKFFDSVWTPHLGFVFFVLDMFDYFYT
jgi:hypothetical protein